MVDVMIRAICCLFLVNIIAAEINNGEGDKSSDRETWIKGLPHKFKSAVNESDVPFPRMGEIMLQQMCEQNGDNDTYEGALAALKDMGTCFGNVLMFSKLPKEIEDAKPRGMLDEVFSPYCHRVDEFKSCVHKSLVNITPCFDVDQKSSKNTIMNITNAILKFACERDGDYIALFIAEKGPQCISSMQPGIEQCVRKGLNNSKTQINYANYESTTNETNVDELVGLHNANREPEKPFSLSFQLEGCRTAYKIRNCIIAELLKCPDKTPANVIESIFNLIQRSTTCAKYSRSQLESTS